jgi:hypothetical protein
MSSALQIPSDISLTVEPIPSSTNRAFVYKNIVITPKDDRIAIHATNYIAVPDGHSYILGAAREGMYNRGLPVCIPTEITFHPQLITALDLIVCTETNTSEAFLRIKMVGPLGSKPTKPEVCDAVHLVKLPHNTLVQIKKQLAVDECYDKTDFSDGALKVLENYFDSLGDDAPMDKTSVEALDKMAVFRIQPYKIEKSKDADGKDVEKEVLCDRFEHNTEHIGLLKRHMTKGQVPVPKKRQAEMATEDLKARLEEAEAKVAKYERVFPHISEIPGTSGVLVTTSMAKVTQTTIDGNIGFLMSDDKA